MKLKLTRVASTLLVLAGGLSAVTALQSNSNGITGRSQVGCGGGGCHGNMSNSATGINLFNGPTGGYTPGQTYNLSLTVTNTTKTKAGFDLTVSSGTLSNASAGMAISGDEARHTTPAIMSSGAAAWNFSWTAPAAGSGLVTINVACNAVNGNGSADASDAWNTISFSFSEATGPTGPTVSTQAATAITSTSATLNGSGNANGGTYVCGFKLGTTTNYGSVIIGSPNPFGGTSTTAFTGLASSLSPNTLYHFIAALYNPLTPGDTTFGTDMTFTTLNATSVATVQSAGIRFFPNPVSDRLMVDLHNTGMDVREVRVSDMTGRVLNVVSTKTASGVELQVASLPAGQYYLLVAGQNGKLVASTFTKQ